MNVTAECDALAYMGYYREVPEEMVNTRYVCGRCRLTYRITSQGKSLMGGAVFRVLQ